MKFKNLIINSVIGILGVISCVKCMPLEVIYTGDSCDCPKNLNYLVNMPPPPEPKEYKPSEYDYKLEVPLQGKAKVTYSFDFTVEEPQTPPPPPQNKWNLYAKIDRITAHKKDCIKEVSNTCSCNRCAVARDYANRYVLPEEYAARYTRNLPHPNNIDDIQTSSKSQIMAIFLEPLKQATLGGLSKSRNKRDISRIFMRPRKNEKRSDRVVKQYSKRLTDPVSNKAFLGETAKPIRSRSIPSTAPVGVRPLQQLTSFLNLPRFRNKRDIKGEYDLIEKEREQMDLTLPEIIQYMPETLDPNFKRNQCHFGQQCQKPELTETTTKTTTTLSTSTSSETTTTTSIENKENKQETLTVAENNKDLEEEREAEAVTEDENENAISSHTKRNAEDYNSGSGGCPLVFNGYNPTPNKGYIFEPLPSFEAIPRPFVSADSPYGSDPVPQQYVGAPHNPYVPSELLDHAPLVGAAYPNPNMQPVSNAQLDRIIAEIVNRHADFIDASSHRGGALVDPTGVQEHQAKTFLKNLMAGNWNGWFGEGQQQPQQQHVHAHIPHYHVPAAGHVHSPPLPPSLPQYQ